MTSQQPTAQPGRTLTRYQLGTELKRLRLSQSLRLADVAARLDVAPSTLSRIETGKALTKTSYLAVLLDVYQVDDARQRERLDELARAGRRNAWWAACQDLLPAGTGDYLDLETAATHLRAYSALTLPDLVRTPGYAAAAYQATMPGLIAGQLRALTDLHRRRQQLVLDNSTTQLDVIIDEAVLLRQIGPAHVLAGQLDHLRTLADRTLVTVGVMPLRTGQLGPVPVFTLLSFAGQPAEDLACHPGPFGQVTITTDHARVGALQHSFADLATTAMPYHQFIQTP